MPAQYTKRSVISGVTRTMSFPMYEQDEFDRRLIAWKDGKLTLQDAFPEISPSAREFVKDGMTTEEWNNYLNYEDEKESALSKWTNTNEIFF